MGESQRSRIQAFSKTKVLKDAWCEADCRVSMVLQCWMLRNTVPGFFALVSWTAQGLCNLRYKFLLCLYVRGWRMADNTAHQPNVLYTVEYSTLLSINDYYLALPQVVQLFRCYIIPRQTPKCVHCLPIDAHRPIY